MNLERTIAITSLAAIGGLSLACDKNDAVEDTRAKIAASAIPLASSASSTVSQPATTASAKPVGSCPPDMVKVPGRFCIDRYEATIYDTKLSRRASPHYHPSHYAVKDRFEFFKEADEAWADQLDAGVDGGLDGGTDAGPPTRFKMVIPKPPAWQLEGYFRVKAASEKGVMPNAFLSGTISESACKNAGKRLCTEEEWVTACKGENQTKFPYGDTYEEGACNIFRQGHVAQKLHGHYNYMSDPRLNLVPIRGQILLEKTGNRPKCVSKWGEDGIYDMVGNLDEWIDDPRGIFLGGFYARQTDEGCNKKEPAHSYRLYYDYSLGTRCCLNLVFNQD